MEEREHGGGERKGERGREKGERRNIKKCTIEEKKKIVNERDKEDKEEKEEREVYHLSF